ncbi:MAG: RidA family protein [Woeseiaceae bacterium]|nr:RidA family protein [Woeseiaceae bacterium]
MSDQRRRVHSGAEWEQRVGYCRAVRTGNYIVVSGTAPVGDDGGVVGEGDAYAQARRCIDIIERALREVDATLADVVRTRMFVTDIGQWEAIGRAHAEAFGANPPATTMVEVSKLIDPRMLVEIEADAIIAS